MKDLTFWVDEVLRKARLPKFTERNMKNTDESERLLPCYFPKRKIVGIHGPMQSGKDTLGKILVDDFGFKRVAFADALREALYALNPIVPSSEFYYHRLKEIVDEKGWDKAKVEIPEIRRLLQVLGTEAGRDIHGQNCWTDIVAHKFEEEPQQSFVCTDVRFPNEVEIIKDYDGIVIRLERTGTSPSDSHVSEQFLENCDFVVENNGTLEELKEKIINTVFPKISVV